ncbi:leucine-rich repeat and WD repeat-containing protein 1 isoform 3-T3 [Molossus nigricans]
MGPLSARLLMERGRPKSDRLGRIRSLDLSGLKLLSEHLDPKLLSRLTQLQELDLSNNQLEMLPANLGLSHLRILRCANNQLGDVTALCQFPELEELSLEGNPFLTVSDNLKVSFLLPKLRKVNGKDASSTSSQVENLNRELTSRARLVASKRPDDVPLNLSPNKRVRTSPLAQVEGHSMGSDGSQPALKLEPLYFLQCHSKNNSPQDLKTQLWACAFEPAWEEGHTEATSQSVATCGGEAVCVIDCQTGIVLHKYKAPGEEFFSVAWTALMVVTQAGHKKRWSVLAAAGLRGQVRLLHVRAGFCCGIIRAHKKAIATLCFSPTHETYLFTASYDKRIILWDIGVPKEDYTFQASQLLTLDTTSTPLRLSPVASCPDAYLLAGCEGGCCCWDVRLDQPQKRRVCEVEFVFSEGSEARGQRVDGLAFVNEDVVASKGNDLGTICLWSWSQTWVSRGSQSTVAVVVLARLQWSPTELAYFSLSTCPDEGIVLCGDEEGNVWIYDVRHILAQQPPLPATPQAPTQILTWPQPRALSQTVTKTMVNTVVANPTFTYLTALTDSNIVAIWKRH